MNWLKAGALAALALFLGALLAPAVARAESPAEQLERLAKHVDAAMERLAAGDRPGAGAEYQAFDSGWFDIEDGIRAQSKASYRAIEDAMGDAKFALRAEPFDAGRAQAVLTALRSAADRFITGQPEPASGAPSESSDKDVTLPSVIGRVDRALTLLYGNDVAGAAAEVSAFRRDWTEVEGLVKAKSGRVYTSTENNMAKAHALLTQAPPDLVGARETLERMKADLAPYAQGEVRYGVFDSMIILLREGLEALLIVGALLAFLKRTGNAAKERWIWAGGGAGVAASAVVAFIINIALSRAGAQAEFLEGITALVAAAMLLYVSFWLHSKASLGAWNQYISDKATGALARNSLISLALIAFLAVFREGAETVLFYVGIAPATATGDLLLGIGLGAAGLLVIGALILAFGVRVPIRPFFLATSALIYYLAFKFVGTGIHALQVAGKLRATPSDYLPTNEALGLFPTWQTTAVQAVLVLGAIAVLLLMWTRNRSRPEPALREERVNPGSRKP